MAEDIVHPVPCILLVLTRRVEKRWNSFPSNKKSIALSPEPCPPFISIAHKFLDISLETAAAEQEEAPDAGISDRVAYAEQKRLRNRTQAEERRLQSRLDEVETLIHILEEQLAELARRLENPPPDPGKVQKLGEEYSKKESRLNELLGEWEQLHS